MKKEINFNFQAINTKRKSGVIMHISSLPEKYGIGTFGKEAYAFADFLKDSGFHYWQILPLGPTGYGDSPYQSFSSFAGNPYFIDLDTLNEEGLLKKSDYNKIDFGDNPERVDYGKLYNKRYAILHKAFKNFRDIESLEKFKRKHKSWLDDYVLFMSIKEHFGGLPWVEWPEELRNRDKKALKRIKEELKASIDFQYFMQYEFYKQYTKLKKYVNNLGIKIIGDIPIYCALDSADVWVDSEEFNLDLVGGCPPDGYSMDGQLWGNPVYNWKKMKKEGYSWWINRVEKTFKLYDVLRMDHFRGFESYWAIPANAKTAAAGKWVKGPGYSLFKAIETKLGKLDIIAEDLGYTTEEVVKFRIRTGFPGMKMMQFAFCVEEESDFLPHNIERNWSAYASTHDSDTVKGWLETMKGKPEYKFAKDYLKLNDEEGEVWGFIRGAWSSVANIAITQIQDFLEMDNTYRMNLPSTLGNWTFRVKKGALTNELSKKIYAFNKLYSRLNKKE